MPCRRTGSSQVRCTKTIERNVNNLDIKEIFVENMNHGYGDIEIAKKVSKLLTKEELSEFMYLLYRTAEKRGCEAFEEELYGEEEFNN